MIKNFIFVSIFQLSSITGLATYKSQKNNELLFDKELITTINNTIYEDEGYNPNFKNVSKKLNVLNKNKEKFGMIYFFDDNKGYLLVNNSNEIMQSDYKNGFDINITDSDFNYIVYKDKKFYDSNNHLLHDRFKNSNNTGGKSFLMGGDFYWHADSSFTSQKVRYVLTEWDSYYSTLTNTSGATFGNAITWSTDQTGNNCGPLAIANLLYTYKMNNTIDLTNGAASSLALANSLESYVLYSTLGFTLPATITNVNSFINSSNYEIDYCDVTNGISDTLSIAPLIGFYSDVQINEAHYVLVTGKGRSVYMKVFGINFYTSWDIVNTWYDTYDTRDGYICKKYWVDNQYINSGYVLRNKNNNQVLGL